MKKEMKKTIKYGSLSAAFVAVVLAAVVLMNLFITLIESKVSLTIDLTDKGVYSVSAAAKEFIKDINTPITIYFCKSRDLLEGDQYTLMVRNLIEEFDKEYDNLQIKYIDIDRDKALADKWNKESGTTVTPNSIVVQNDITGQFRHLYPQGFFATAQSTGKLYAFKGEITLTNAIIQVSGEARPIIAFTTGHAEDVNNTALKTTLTEAGFEIVTVDLTKENIPENTKIVFINNPKYDFLGLRAEEDGEINGDANEIDKLADFMVKFNHVIVTVDPSTPELPELKDFLAEYGLGWTPKAQIFDRENSLTGSLTNGTRLIGKFVTDNKETAAYQAHKSLSEMPSPPKVIFSNSVPLVLSAPTKANYSAFSSFSTFNTAQIYKNNIPDATGETPLMAISSSSKYIGEAGEQVMIYSTVTLIGTNMFTADRYINEQYGNKEVMYSLARMMGSRRVPNGLEFKVFFNEGLVINQRTAETLTIVISFIAPLIVAVIGFVVFLKRRHL